MDTTYSLIKIIHITGILSVFMGLGAILLHSMGSTETKFVGKRWAMLFHGVGLLVVLVSGLALMVHIHIPHSPPPLWIFVKLGIWLCLGGVAGLIIRRPKLAPALWVVILCLGALAATMANVK